jgi:hypothetical protein
MALQLSAARKLDLGSVVMKANPYHGANGEVSSKGGAGMGQAGHTDKSVRDKVTVHNPKADGTYEVSHQGQKMGAVQKAGKDMNSEVAGKWVSQHNATGEMNIHATQEDAVRGLSNVHANYMNKMHAQVGENAKFEVGDTVHTTGIGAGPGKVVGMHPLSGQWQYQVEKTNEQGGKDIGSHPEKSLDENLASALGVGKHAKKADTMTEEDDPANKIQTPTPFSDMLRRNNPVVGLQTPEKMAGGIQFSNAT